MEIEFVTYATVRDAVGQKSVFLAVPEAVTVAGAVRTFADEYQSVHPLLFDGDGDLRPHINVLVDGENVRTDTDGFERTLTKGSQVGIAPGVSGGNRMLKRTNGAADA